MPCATLGQTIHGAPVMMNMAEQYHFRSNTPHANWPVQTAPIQALPPPITFSIRKPDLGPKPVVEECVPLVADDVLVGDDVPVGRGRGAAVSRRGRSKGVLVLSISVLLNVTTSVFCVLPKKQLKNVSKLIMSFIYLYTTQLCIEMI